MGGDDRVADPAGAATAYVLPTAGNLSPVQFRGAVAHGGAAVHHADHQHPVRGVYRVDGGGGVTVAEGSRTISIFGGSLSSITISTKSAS